VVAAAPTNEDAVPGKRGDVLNGRCRLVGDQHLIDAGQIRGGKIDLLLPLRRNRQARGGNVPVPVDQGGYQAIPGDRNEIEDDLEFLAGDALVQELLVLFEQGIFKATEFTLGQEKIGPVIAGQDTDVFSLDQRIQILGVALSQVCIEGMARTGILGMGRYTGGQPENNCEQDSKGPGHGSLGGFQEENGYHNESRLFSTARDAFVKAPVFKFANLKSLQSRSI